MNDHDCWAEKNDRHCVADDLADQWLAGAPWRRLAVLGDNVRRGSGQAVPGYRRRSWAQRVAKHLRRQQPDLVEFNPGRRHMPAADIRAQQLATALGFEPDITAMWCGGDEIFSQPFDADVIETEITRIVMALRRQRSEVIIVGPADFTWSTHIPEQLKSPMRQLLNIVSARANEVALHHGSLHVNLVSHPSALDGSIFNHESRYLNSRGHAIVAAEVIRRLAVHLGNCVDCGEDRPLLNTGGRGRLAPGLPGVAG